MVRRDPETGQFVSGAGGGGTKAWSETEQVVGAISFTINAADLSGGTGSRSVMGEDCKLVDFGDFLANDEVFIIDSMQVVAAFGLPTTATAESSGTFGYSILPKGSGAHANHSSPFYRGSADRTSDQNVDVNHAWNSGDSAFAVGYLRAEASHSDTTNGLAAGAEYENERYTVNFRTDYGARPAFDQDDELYAPCELSFDNISDHAVDATIKVLVQGEIQELD